MKPFNFFSFIIHSAASLPTLGHWQRGNLNNDLIAKFIAENVNSFTDEGEFPSELKHADIVRIHKKKGKSDKSNYRPVSNYSKVYEKLIYNQLYQYFENILFLS